MCNKTKFRVEYRSGGHWFPLASFPTKAAAQSYAQKSSTCQRKGYQINKIK